jgi:hypothetical protein
VDIRDVIFKGVDFCEIETHYAEYIPRPDADKTIGLVVWIIYRGGKVLCREGTESQLKLLLDNIQGVAFESKLRTIDFYWGVRNCGRLDKFCHVLMSVPDVLFYGKLGLKEKDLFLNKLDKYYY